MLQTNINQDRQLLSEIARGNEAAFRQFFDNWQPILLTFVYRLTKSYSVTEEIVQDVFIKIWSGRQQLPRVEHPKSYIFKITKNYTLDHLRTAMRTFEKQRQYENSLSGLPADNSTTDKEMQINQESLLEKAVAALPAQQQKAFRLAKQKGYSYEQIAGLMNISPGTVKYYIKLALASIRKELENTGSISVITLTLSVCYNYF